MRSLVGHVAAGKIPEIAPVAEAHGVKGLARRGPNEPVPVELLAHYRPRMQRRVPVPLRPHQIYFAERAVVEVLLGFDDAGRAAPLHADLDDAVGLADRRHHFRSLFDRVRHRLLTIGVLAGGDRVNQLAVVPVLGGGKEHRVNVLAGEELPVVAITLRRAARHLDPQVQVDLVDVAHGGELHCSGRRRTRPRRQALLDELLHHAPAAPARSDQSHHQPVVRPKHPSAESRVVQDAQAYRRTLPQEFPSIDSVALHKHLPTVCSRHSNAKFAVRRGDVTLGHTSALDWLRPRCQTARGFFAENWLPSLTCRSRKSRAAFPRVEGKSWSNIVTESAFVGAGVGSQFSADWSLFYCSPPRGARKTRTY